MDGDELAKLRKLTGQLHKLTYETAKADMVAELPHEQQLFARAMGQWGNARTHDHLLPVLAAVPPFADDRFGLPTSISWHPFGINVGSIHGR